MDSLLTEAVEARWSPVFSLIIETAKQYREEELKRAFDLERDFEQINLRLKKLELELLQKTKEDE